MTINSRLAFVYLKASVIMCFYIVLAVMIFFMLSISSSLAEHKLQGNYDDGKVTIDGLQAIPSVENIKVKELFNKNIDASALSNLTDQDLVNQGAKELNNSEVGNFLVRSEEAKIDALQEHKLHEKNGLLERSQKIEADPLKVTGGDNYTVTEKITKVREDKTCLEGVDFEVDIVRQLILSSEVTEGFGNWQNRAMSIKPEDLGYWSIWGRQANKFERHGGGSWSDVRYIIVREEDPNVQILLR